MGGPDRPTAKSGNVLSAIGEQPMGNPFIFSCTNQEAIEDGVLVDISGWGRQ